jgi:hypothetical protein
MGHTDMAPSEEITLTCNDLRLSRQLEAALKSRARSGTGSGTEPWGTFVGACSTEVLFSAALRGLNLDREQFWGRAARASRDSKESWGARYIFRFIPASGLCPPASSAILKTLHHSKLQPPILRL